MIDYYSQLFALKSNIRRHWDGRDRFCRLRDLPFESVKKHDEKNEFPDSLSDLFFRVRFRNRTFVRSDSKICSWTA